MKNAQQTDKRTVEQTVKRLVLPIAETLFLLARANALHLLLSQNDEVRVVLSDVGAFEVRDDVSIRQFIEQNHRRIVVMPTTVGELVLKNIEPKRKSGQLGSVPREIRDQAITGMVISGEPTWVIADDEFMGSYTFALPANARGLSMSAWLFELERMQLLDSAAVLQARMKKS